MPGVGEKVVGEILVAAKLAVGSERLRLFLTDERIIFARVGKRGAGELATAGLLGRFSAALEELFKGGRESLKTRRVRELTPDEILQLDRDNFQVLHQDIVSVQVEGGPTGVTIIFLTKEDKLVFRTGVDFQLVVGPLMQTLGEKVRATRSGTSYSSPGAKQRTNSPSQTGRLKTRTR